MDEASVPDTLGRQWARSRYVERVRTVPAFVPYQRAGKARVG